MRAPRPPSLPPPTAEELLENPALVDQLTGFLITQLTPDLRIQKVGQSWELHFRLHV